jgi:hypothetical protein
MQSSAKQPEKSKLVKAANISAIFAGSIWIINVIAAIASRSSEEMMPWFAGPLLISLVVFGFLFLLTIAQSIEGRFYFRHVTFAISGVICAPLAATWFSPPLGDVPPAMRETALNIFMTTLVVTGLSTVLHWAFMMRRRNLLAKKVDAKSPEERLTKL